MLKDVGSVILYNHPSISTKKICSFCHKKGIKVYADCTEWFDPKGFSAHNTIKRLDTWYRMKHVNKHLDGIITISSFLQNYYKKYGCKTMCVPPLIDLTQEKWAKSETIASLTENGKHLIYVGNPGAGTKDKLTWIIKALKQVKVKRSDLHFNLDIVGMTEEQFNNVFKMSLAGYDFVRFHGRKPNIEALNFIKRSDYTIFLRENNLICTAGFPTKFSESLACGTPVLTNISSDLGKYLKDGVNGYEMNITSNEALTSSLEKALSLGREELKRMKEYCAKDNTFDYHSFVDEFAKMF